jgi:probable rRNA maturation factor
MSPAGAALTVQDVRVPGGRRRVERALMRLAAEAERRAGRPVDLSFVVMDDAALRRWNRRSLGHDWETDVLSFPLAEQPVLMGEVLMSADTARREARARGHSAYDELMLYAVHGVLHLLGHDDHAPAGRRSMRRAEREVLATLGCTPSAYEHPARPDATGTRDRVARRRVTRRRVPRGRATT